MQVVYSLLTGKTELNDVVPVDYSYDPPVVTLPDLEPYQFHSMIKLTGYEAEVLQAIATDPDPMFQSAALAKFQYSKHYKRDDPFVVGLAGAIGLSDVELDSIWLAAADF